MDKSQRCNHSSQNKAVKRYFPMTLSVSSLTVSSIKFHSNSRSQIRSTDHDVKS